MQETKILVTGASGLLGAYLIAELLRKGYRNIRAIRRPGSRMDLLEALEGKIEWFYADIQDVADLNEAMEGIELVFHCAALVSFDPRKKKQLMLVNVEGTANVVNSALAAGVKKLIHVSSIAALGRNKKDKPIDEQTVWEKSKWNSDYGLSKYLAEREVWRAMGEGMQVAMVNPSMILGAGRWSEGTGNFFSMIWQGFPFYPAGSTGFVDAGDVAAFMVQLIEEDQAFGKKYILSSENLSYFSFFSAIAAGLGKQAPRIKVNAAFRLLAGLWSYPARWFSSSELMLTPQTLRQSAVNSVYDNTMSETLTGFSYTPVSKTIERLCAGFLAQAKTVSE